MTNIIELSQLGAALRAGAPLTAETAARWAGRQHGQRRPCAAPPACPWARAAGIPLFVPTALQLRPRLALPPLPLFASGSATSLIRCG